MDWLIEWLIDLGEIYTDIITLGSMSMFLINDQKWKAEGSRWSRFCELSTTLNHVFVTIVSSVDDYLDKILIYTWLPLPHFTTDNWRLLTCIGLYFFLIETWTINMYIDMQTHTHKCTNEHSREITYIPCNRKKITRNIQRKQTPAPLWLLTLSCDLNR